MMVISNIKEGTELIDRLKDRVHEQFYEIQEKNEKINNLEDRIERALNVLDNSAMNKGMCTQPETDTIQHTSMILRGEL